MKIKLISPFLLFFLFTMMLLPSPKASGAELPRFSLSEEQQALFLTKRIPCNALRLARTFDTYANHFYALYDICLHTDYSAVSYSNLSYVFPEFYRPTFGELVYMIARQTKTTCRYDPERDYWVFNPPSMDLPYSLNIAKGWILEDCGSYIKFYPEIAPVGMDIYFLGNYSAEENENMLFDRVKMEWALAFIKSFSKEMTVDDMKKVDIDGVKALYAEVHIKKRKLTWRQWAFVKKGHAFLIVSAIDDKNKKKLLPDVQAMVGSFKLKE